MITRLDTDESESIVQYLKFHTYEDFINCLNTQFRIMMYNEPLYAKASKHCWSRFKMVHRRTNFTDPNQIMIKNYLGTTYLFRVKNITKAGSCMRPCLI